MKTQALPPDRRTIVLALRTLQYVLDGYRVEIRDQQVTATNRQTWKSVQLGPLPTQITSVEDLANSIEADELSL